jgi:hypothetical protein
MTTAHAGWWRLEHRVQRPTSDVSGGRGAVVIEVFWSSHALVHQARLLEPEVVGCP